MQLQLSFAKRSSMADLQTLKTRVRILNKEENKIQSKIKNTKTLANKMASVKQVQQDRFLKVQQMNRERTLQTLNQAISIEQERQRHKNALERARKDKELAVLIGSITVKKNRKADKEFQLVEKDRLKQQTLMRNELIKQAKLQKEEIKMKNFR